MASISFLSDRVVARIRNPLKNFELTEDSVEIRRDPLLGDSMRISSAKGLDKLPGEDFLTAFAQNSNPCFFCEGRVENATPKMPAHMDKEGRLSKGKALLFPNLSGFARYSGVCIFSKQHFIHPQEFTAGLIFDALRVCQDYFKKCAAHDDDILYPTVNSNYLLPAGSSLLHPHLQPVLDPFPTNMHRRLLEESSRYYRQNQSDFWDDLKEAERNGPRFVHESSHSYWQTPFAPSGFVEFTGIMKAAGSYVDLDQEEIADLAGMLKNIIRFYHSCDHNSFNFTIFSPPVNAREEDARIPVIVKIVSRPVFAPYYRSDVTFFEKLHGETMIDKLPEETAREFRQFLQSQTSAKQ